MFYLKRKEIEFSGVCAWYGGVGCFNWSRDLFSVFN